MRYVMTVLNGPNLNLLGTREPEIYGSETLKQIESRVREHASVRQCDVEFLQSNHEGVLVDTIHAARQVKDAIIINAGALTHTSVALHDALIAYDGIVIEIHLSNIFQRESYRHHSFIALAANGTICGFGGFGYLLAIDAACELINTEQQARSRNDS